MLCSPWVFTEENQTQQAFSEDARLPTASHAPWQNWLLTNCHPAPGTWQPFLSRWPVLLFGGEYLHFCFSHQLQRGRQEEKEQEIEEARLSEPLLGPQSTPGIQKNALFYCCFVLVCFSTLKNFHQRLQSKGWGLALAPADLQSYWAAVHFYSFHSSVYL